MSAVAERQARYQREAPTAQLGHLGSNLSRIASLLDHPQEQQTLLQVFRESEYFVEWTATHWPFEIQDLLLQLQVRLAMWRRVWPRLGDKREFRLAVAREAEQWSEILLRKISHRGTS